MIISNHAVFLSSVADGRFVTAKPPRGLAWGERDPSWITNNYGSNSFPPWQAPTKRAFATRRRPVMTKAKTKVTE